MTIPSVLGRLLIIGLLVIAASINATAQTTCRSRVIALERLQKNFNEFPLIELVRANGYVEVFISADGGSWTLLYTQFAAPEISCSIASGSVWRPLYIPTEQDLERVMP